MLLKSCFTIEPPAGQMNDFWPSLAQQLDEAGSGTATGGGSVGNGKDEIRFTSSSAMQILKIPDPKVDKVVEAPVVAAAPTESPQETPSPWRWPVALIASTVILVVGVLVYQNRQVQMQGAGFPAGGIAAAPSQDHMNQGGPEPTAVAMAPTADEERGEPQPGSEPEPPAEPAPGVDPAAAPADEPKPGEPGDTAAPAGDDKAAAKRKHGGRKRSKTGRKAGASAKPAAVAAAPSPTATPKPAKAKPKAGGKGDDLLDSLIDNALGDEEKAKKGAPKKAEKKKSAVNMDLPEQLSMNQIRGAMNRVKGLVQSCYDQYQVEGRANVQMLITPDGTPTKMRIKGKFFGTDTGTCVIKAAKKAQFPKFRGKPMTIKYPFLLQ